MTLPPVTPEEMRALLDRQAISELIARYCRAVDRLDVPLGRSIWHPGATADYGEAVYRGDGPGVIDHICAQHAYTLHHSHQVTTTVIDVRGDEAGSEAYHFAALRIAAGDAVRQMSIWGRYIDRWERRDGRWGLVHRQAIRDFDEVREVQSLAHHDVARRDRTDPSYAVFGEEAQ